MAKHVKLRPKYGELTDDDLTFAKGKEDEMYGRLLKKIGKARAQIQKEIENL